MDSSRHRWSLNDEQVSAELGKKIFAYADFVMESKRSKPVMKLSVEMMGEEFVKKQKALIENESQLWQEIYDISTIGHRVWAYFMDRQRY